MRHSSPLAKRAVGSTVCALGFAMGGALTPVALGAAEREPGPSEVQAAEFTSAVQIGAATDEGRSLALRASLDSAVCVPGCELRPAVELVNISSRPIQLDFMKPWHVVPEIWDVSRKRLTGGPAIAIDQIVVPEHVLLQPHGVLTLSAVPIVVLAHRTPAVATRGLHATWFDAVPGHYRLRYSIELKYGIPGAKGTLTANEVTVELKASAGMTEPGKRVHLAGKLGFEAGRGYFLSLAPGAVPGGVTRVWLRISEDKVLVRRLEALSQQRIEVTGILEVGSGAQARETFMRDITWPPS